MTKNDNLADIITDQQIHGSKWKPDRWIKDLERLENGSYKETEVAERNLLGEETLVTMATGQTRTLSKIKAGDKIMGLYGEELVVKHVIKGDEELYEIKPVRGDTYLVNGDYMLLLKATNYEMIFWDKTRKRYRIRWLQNYGIKEKSFPLGLYNHGSGSKRNGLDSFGKRKKIVYRNCEQYLRKVKSFPGYIGYGDIIQIRAKDYAKMTPRVRNVFKAFSVGVDYDEKKVEIDPYVLGYWLGDGTSAGTGITTAEEEVVEYFEKYAKKNNLVIIKGRRYHYDVTTGTKYGGPGRNPFKNGLKKYNLLNNKHIPLNYLQNSRKIRLALLAGLIDSDGSNSANTYDFIFKSEKLADDVIYLARSLGFKAFKKETKKTCTNSSRGRVTGTYYRFHIYGEGLEKIPCLVERKQAHKRETKKDAQVTGIKIKKVGKRKCRGLILDKNQKFILSDFTIGQNCY